MRKNMYCTRQSSVAAAMAFGVTAIFAHSTNAASLTCAENPATNGYFCFNEKELRIEAGIRTAPLYTGGPKGVTRSPYFIAANCDTGVMHLKDKQGVSFGGAGPSEGTTQSRQLRTFVCEASLGGPKKK